MRAPITHHACTHHACVMHMSYTYATHITMHMPQVAALLCRLAAEEDAEQGMEALL